MTYSSPKSFYFFTYTIFGFRYRLFGGVFRTPKYNSISGLFLRCYERAIQDLQLQIRKLMVLALVGLTLFARLKAVFQ